MTWCHIPLSYLPPTQLPTLAGLKFICIGISMKLHFCSPMRLKTARSKTPRLCKCDRTGSPRYALPFCVRAYPCSRCNAKLPHDTPQYLSSQRNITSNHQCALFYEPHTNTRLWPVRFLVGGNSTSFILLKSQDTGTISLYNPYAFCSSQLHAEQSDIVMKKSSTVQTQVYSWSPYL